MRALLLLLILFLLPPRASAEPAAPPALPEARAALEAAMADPAFHRWRRDRVAEVPDRELLEGPWADRVRAWLEATMKDIGDAIEEFLDGIFNRNPGPSSSGGNWDWLSGLGLPGLLWWLGVGLSVLVVLLLSWVAWLAWRQRPRRRRRVPEPAAMAAALQRGGALEAEADEWIDHAAGLAEGRGGEDLRLAYRAMYLALLAGLHRRGWIRFAPSRTNGAYVRGFRGPSATPTETGDGPRESFARLTELFDGVWYGHESPDAAGFPAVRAEVERLLREDAR